MKNNNLTLAVCRSSFIILSLMILITACKEKESAIQLPEVSESAVNFIVANDLGRNGYYEQKPIAQLMGYTAENMDVEMIAAAGDVHHFEGVASVNDPLWMTNYELIYSHPELMIEWNVICGNHEYRGNTQAILDYAKVSRRWNAPARYYTKVMTTDNDTACLLVFIDTTPLMDKYRNDSISYPDAYKQDATVQLQWIDSVLTCSAEKWKIVIGHHPVYAGTEKEESERAELQAHLAPLLERRGVDIYFSGHIHNFQHIQPEYSLVHYIVNSSGSLSRPAKEILKIPGTLFYSGDAGFTICSVSEDFLRFFFINSKGETIYNYTIAK